MTCKTNIVYICNKADLKLKQYYEGNMWENGYYLFVGKKHLNTYEAYEEFKKHNNLTFDEFKTFVKSKLIITN